MLRTVLIVAAWLVAAVARVRRVRVRHPPGRDLAHATRRGCFPTRCGSSADSAADRAIPRRTRWLVGLLLVYLVSPLDLVPDFVPAIGFADDAIITAFVLRHVIRKAGPDKLQEHWPGSAGRAHNPDATATTPGNRRPALGEYLTASAALPRARSPDRSRSVRVHDVARNLVGNGDEVVCEMEHLPKHLDRLLSGCRRPPPTC